MDQQRMNECIGSISLTIAEAMAKIDENAMGILFIVDENQHLMGTLTDGDIRRWILHSGQLTENVGIAMNPKPYALNIENQKKAVMLMKEKNITAVPIIDHNKLIIDICLRTETDQNKKRGDLSSVSVVIMAGGRGTRLYPYTRILPKPLVPIGDIPIVERIIDYYTDFGIKLFYMTVNYKKAMIRSYFDDLSPEYQIKYVEEDKPLGTGGSIRLISDKFDKPIFITNCDALILADYYDIYQYHLNSGNDITMISALKNFQLPYGVLHIGENGIIKSIDEKPKLSYFINTGMYVINPDMIELIPSDKIFHMTDLVEVAMENGKQVGTYPVSEDSFLDMGKFDEMKRMEEKLGVVTDKG